MREDARSSRVCKVLEGDCDLWEDDIVVEEPVEIRVDGDCLLVTMRTPGNDFDLAIGLLFSERIIRSLRDIGAMAYCPDEDDPRIENVINVTLVRRTDLTESRRAFWAYSSCGLCGASTIAGIRKVCSPVVSGFSVPHGVLCEIPDRLRELQVNFGRTGGIHAAALFDASGGLSLLREDVGRHNAVDKVIGAALRSGETFQERGLVVSGRLGFEIAQKALTAGISIVASLSAPTTLAVDLASEFGMTAVGFLRKRSLNIYSHPERIQDVLSKHPA